MSYLDEVEKQSSPALSRTDKSSIAGLEVELEERKKQEEALARALKDQKEQLKRE